MGEIFLSDGQTPLSGDGFFLEIHIPVWPTGGGPEAASEILEMSSALRLVFTCGSPSFAFCLELVEVAAQDHSRHSHRK